MPGVRAWNKKEMHTLHSMTEKEGEQDDSVDSGSRVGTLADSSVFSVGNLFYSPFPGISDYRNFQMVERDGRKSVSESE